MPSKKKPAAAGMTALPSIPKELIEQLTGGATPMTADQINATNCSSRWRLRRLRHGFYRGSSRSRRF